MEAPINDFNGPGLYLFQVQHSKKYLDLDESKKANHTKVQQWYGNLWCPGRISTDMVNLVTGRHESTMRTRTGSLLPQGMTNTSSWRTRQGHVWLLLVLSLFIYIMSKKWNFLLVNMSLSFSQRKTENQLLEISSQQLISISGGSLSARKMELTCTWILLFWRFLREDIIIYQSDILIKTIL